MREENPDERISQTRGYLNCREQSLLLIHIFQFQTKEPNPTNLTSDIPVVSVSVGLTSTGFKPRERQYAASVRMMEQLREASRDQEGDDMVLDND